MVCGDKIFQNREGNKTNTLTIFSSRSSIKGCNAALKIANQAINITKNRLSIKIEIVPAIHVNIYSQNDISFCCLFLFKVPLFHSLVNM